MLLAYNSLIHAALYHIDKVAFGSHKIVELAYVYRFTHNRNVLGYI